MNIYLVIIGREYINLPVTETLAAQTHDELKMAAMPLSDSSPPHGSPASQQASNYRTTNGVCYYCTSLLSKGTTVYQ